MKIKKLVSVLLILVMVCTCFAACGGEETNPSGTGTPTSGAGGTADGTVDEVIVPEETITLDVYSQLANYSGIQVGWSADVLLEKFNVKINIIPEQDGVLMTRMESGNLGDIVIWGADGDDYQNAANAGLLWDWDDEDLLTNYGPYIKENMSKALEKNRSITDGTLYGFGHNVAANSDDHEAFFYYSDIRWDLYKQLGYPEVGTLEDLVDILAQMVEICPTSDSGSKTYGISLFPDWDGDMVMYVKATAAMYGYDEFGIGLYDCKTRTYNHLFAEDSIYLRCLKFYNTLYQRGLLDPDSMSQTYDEAAEAYRSGAAFYCIFNYLGSASYNTDAHLAEGKAMYPLVADDFVMLTYGLNVNGGNRVWSIGATTQYPELCMSIINWLCTPEGAMTYWYGPQGVTWDYNEEGYAYFTELGEATQQDRKTVMPAPYSGTYNDGCLQINNTTWTIAAPNPEGNNEPYDCQFWRTRQSKEVQAITQDWRDWSGFDVIDDFLSEGSHAVAPGTSYAATPKSSELKTTWDQVTDCIKEYSWKAIYAATDAEYNKIVGEMRMKAYAYGYEKCFEYQNAEAEARKALEDATD